MLLRSGCTSNAHGTTLGDKSLLGCLPISGTHVSFNLAKTTTTKAYQAIFAAKLSQKQFFPLSLSLFLVYKYVCVPVRVSTGTHVHMELRGSALSFLPCFETGCPHSCASQAGCPMSIMRCSCLHLPTPQEIVGTADVCATTSVF